MSNSQNGGENNKINKLPVQTERSKKEKNEMTGFVRNNDWGKEKIPDTQKGVGRGKEKSRGYQDKMMA